MFDYCSKMEANIAKALVRKALAEGYSISVYDGEETTVHASTSESVIFEAMNSTDMDVLIFWKLNPTERRKAGQVMLIWGNEEDLISDHTDNEEMEALTKF